MFKNITILILLFLLGNGSIFAQYKDAPILASKDTIKTQEINTLAPAKAAFYSAILPGLGQAYNKRYWKIPLVYGAIGTSLYFYSWNNDKYDEYRDAYKERLAGFPDPEYDYLSDNQLISAQEFYQKNRDISMLFAIAFYVLNIVDANVDAHLLQFNVNDNLSFNPKLDYNNFNRETNYGLTLNYKFK